MPHSAISQALGRIGEQVARITLNSKKFNGLVNINGRWRVPDGLTRTHLIAVKNVKNVKKQSLNDPAEG